jgi:hypothetical protein
VGFDDALLLARRTTAAPRERWGRADEQLEDAEDDSPFRPRGAHGNAREARAVAAGARGAPARARVAVVVTLDAACMVARLAPRGVFEATRRTRG